MTKKKKIMITIVSVILGIMVAAYIVTAVFFHNHFYSGTNINGINCTNMKVNEVKKELANQVQNYSLNIQKIDGSAETFTAGQLQLSFADNGEIDKIMENQNSWKWIVKAFQKKTYTLKIPINLSDEILSSTVDGLDFMQEENITLPQDAAVGDTDTGYTVTAEVIGNQPDRDKLLSALKDTILSGKSELNLDKAGCYVKPAVYQNDENLINRVNHLNQLVSANVTMNFGSGRVETVGPQLLKTWVAQDESGNDLIDPNQISAYVGQLASKYNTVKASRSFTTSNGSTVQLTGGDYGWKLDQEKTAQNLTDAINSGTQGEVEVVYANTARSRESNDIGNTYIELSIDQQTLWCYVDGKLLVSTPVVTGNISKGNDTPRGGVWKIKGKRTDYIMTGKINPATGQPSYRTHCDYWIPYSEDFTIGIHDLASRAEYGGDIYKTNGSHGCVNTPLSAVSQIFNVVSAGFPVIVY